MITRTWSTASKEPSVAQITSAARTPWAHRHGPLASVRPEVLLQTALTAVLERAGLRSADIDRVLVTCDTSVGAQDFNIARRTVLALDWGHTPALTVDGQGVGGLALIEMASSLPGRTVVASVDASSLVPPGAGQVRDYGRPACDMPEVEWLEALATQLGLSRATLDSTATTFREPSLAFEAVVPVRSGASRTVDTDTQVALPDMNELPPLLASDGLLTAAHLAEYADGAAAVVIESQVPHGRAIVGKVFSAGPRYSIVERLIELGSVSRSGASLLVAETNAVVLAALDRTAAAPQARPVGSPLALGSAPSGDGLRTLVDAFHNIDGQVQVLSRGRDGQAASVSMAARGAQSTEAIG